MLGAERLLADGERAPAERVGLRVATALAREGGERLERGRHFGMLGAERLLGDRERAAGERLGPGPAALLGVDAARA